MPPLNEKILNQQQLSDQILNRLPRPLVFTNGCFDILHRGHISYLEAAAELGNSLLVAVNTDASVRRLNKGKDRPVNPLEDRLAMLAALQSVNFVLAFDEDTPLQLIHLLRPDILVKGGDWSVEDIVGSTDVIAAGGQVHSIPFRYQRSTTSLINKIKSN